MTQHKIIIGNSNNLASIPDKSVNLIITSPPYPMIEMWDEMFSKQNPEISEDLTKGKSMDAYMKMHQILNTVWEECNRVLADSGFVCINIGDATRTIDGNFQLFSNHTAIINFFSQLGYSVLPDILWRKQSNAPNKFMGSGMYPAGAYVTYEHEYILVFRKGNKRIFKGEQKLLRQKSAYFWEERNVWFSDLWDIKGTSQSIKGLNKTRSRNASFPFEIPYRIVNMYSAEGDTVLDPFAGLGTTTLACMASNRQSIAVEIDQEIANLAFENLNVSPESINKLIDERLQRHTDFIQSLPDEKLEKCYRNEPHGFLVKTRQETAIHINKVDHIEFGENLIQCYYK